MIFPFYFFIISLQNDQIFSGFDCFLLAAQHYVHVFIRFICI